MRIKKTSNTRAIAGKVVNVASESTTDAYSCDFINDCNTYSTSETFTGRYWIDNKPIYRKVIETNMTSSKTQATYTLASVGLTNYSTIVDLCSISQGNPINEDYFVSNSDVLRTLINASGLIIQVGSTYPARPLTIYTIVEYTKTTD